MTPRRTSRAARRCRRIYRVSKFTTNRPPTTCKCGCQLKRIGEDVSEKLDYTPGVFTVERHVRGKWVCAKCETLIQTPVPAQVIDKGIPAAGLLAQVLVANTVTSFRCTGRNASLSARAWPFSGQPSHNG